MALDAQYDLYVNSVLQLARTIVIKSNASIEAINSYVRIYHGDDAVSEDPTTWKYYMNICGIYHFTDEKMVITSLDNLEEITFSKEALAVNKATKRAYLYGTRNYQELVSRFPDQETLILGILYPADMTTAVAAEDGTILSYPSSLIEENEYSLQNKIQAWINAYKLRWSNNQYSLSDSHYLTAHLGIMYLHLVPAILNFRIEACKTNEAHSYHVRQYLLSRGLKDSDVDYLNLKQSLWLYRNIDKIRRNAGATETFDSLVEHIMTARNLPLSGFTARHDISNQLTDINPKLTFKRTDISGTYSANSKTFSDLDEFLEKEDGAARANSRLKEELRPLIELNLTHADSSILQTKLLESSVYDESDSGPYPLEETLLNQWLWLASNGIYSAIVTITNPRTGEKIPLWVKDAYVLMWYSYCQTLGIELETVPPMLASRVHLLPTPGIAEMRKMAPGRLVSNDLLTEIRNAMPISQALNSTDAFYNFCIEMHSAERYFRGITAYQEHKDTRAYVEGAINSLFSDNVCQLEPEGTLFSNWLIRKNVDTSKFTTDDYGSVYIAILKEATGTSLNNTKSLKNLQAAMVSIMETLSSYSVQYNIVINNSKIRSANWTAVRVGDIARRSSNHEQVPNHMVMPLETRSTIKETLEYNINNPNANDLIDSFVKSSVAGEVSDILSGSGGKLRFPIKALVSDITPDIGTDTVPGEEQFMALSEEQKATFKDIYGNTTYGA